MSGLREEVVELARELMASWDALVDAASEPGQGCTFELRLVLGGAPDAGG